MPTFHLLQTSPRRTLSQSRRTASQSQIQTQSSKAVPSAYAPLSLPGPSRKWIRACARPAGRYADRFDCPLPPSRALVATALALPSYGPPTTIRFLCRNTRPLAISNRFCTWGYVGSAAIFQSHYETSTLSAYSTSDIAWISSIQLFCVYLTGAFAGNIYDKGYLRHM